MKKQTTYPIQAHLIRGAFYLVLLLAVCVIPFTLAERTAAKPKAPTKFSQRTLTFAERVAYQRAIEEVYWRHRIWPKERPDPKPSLGEVMSQAQLEKKVADYVRNSQALEDYWQRPITAEQLQAEMDRMAEHTKQPGVLRELFDALGNDPFVIAECLARPAVAERLLASTYANDRRSHGELIQCGEAENQTLNARAALIASYKLPTIPNGAGCIDNWAATNTSNAPIGRFFHTAVWSGSEMIVWGGANSSGLLNTGARYNPTTDSWTATTTTNAPGARVSHTAVWTGSEMIVWGGLITLDFDVNTGGRYNPATNSWTPTSTINAPEPRESHTAAWIDSEMVVWGGLGNTDVINTGGRYNPGSDSWTATTTNNAPSARSNHTAVGTGSEMIVWGGQNQTGVPLNTGSKYNPNTDNWTAISTTSAPAARYLDIASWTGSEMIIWGGFDGSNAVNTGGRYNPNADTWIATSTANAPSARAEHTAVWSGSEMIIWGGSDGSNFVNTGGRYNPNADTWIATSTANAPSARAGHTAVWSGSEMIIWGGSDNVGNALDTGGKYCGPPPRATPRPRPTPHPRP